jgi:adenylosuccinate lyase
LTVLDEFGAYPAVIQRELDRYLPFLATTKVLMAAVRNGVGREAAHEAIKEAAVGTALAMRAGQADNDVFAKLAADERLGLTREQIESWWPTRSSSPAQRSRRPRPSYALATSASAATLGRGRRWPELP